MKRAIALIILLTALFATSCGLCDDYPVFILCNPKTPVNVRMAPKKGTSIVGRLDFGDCVETDGVKRNGFLHVYAGDGGDGWIHAGYVVEDQPEKTERAYASVAASGRVLTYKRIGGKRNKWLNIGDELKVYALSEEWAVTNKGYVRTKYLEVWYE